MYWLYFLISFVLIMVAICFMLISKNSDVRYIFMYVLLFGLFGIYLTCASSEYKRGQVHALKGKFMYEQQIRTILNDKNEIVSRDTIYISVE